METLQRIAAASWALTGEMAPYLLLGFLIAGVLSVFISPEWIERHLGRKGLGQVVKASLFGVPLPLCSCGVLPVAASLRRHGAGKGATTSFLLSTPQTGVDSIAITWALLGPVVAVIRPLAAFVTGVAGGSVAQLFESDPEGSAPRAEEACGDECCAEEQGPRFVSALRYGFVTLPRDIGRSLIVGLVLSGIIAAFLEPNALRGVLGEGLLPYLAAMAVGIPLYVCATGSTPIAAALIGAGLSPGAALIFLITGPATNMVSITTLLRVLGRRTVGVYLATVILGSLATGAIVDRAVGPDALAIPAVAQLHAGHEHGADEATGFGFRDAGAIVLLAILAAALLPRRRTEEEISGESPAGERVELTVSGMHCNGCVSSVTRALSEMGGVREVRVDLEGGRAVVEGESLDVEALCAEVRALGFDCESPPSADI